MASATLQVTTNNDIQEFKGTNAVQFGEYNVKQRGGFRAKQDALSGAEQEAGSQAFQSATYKAKQTSYELAVQLAHSCAIQSSGFMSFQRARDGASQTTEERSIQVAESFSVQVAGDYSIQIVGNESIQTAGIGTVQIGTDEDGFPVSFRMVTEGMQNKPYLFINGDWNEISTEEYKDALCSLRSCDKKCLDDLQRTERDIEENLLEITNDEALIKFDTEKHRIEAIDRLTAYLEDVKNVYSEKVELRNKIMQGEF